MAKLAPLGQAVSQEKIGPQSCWNEGRREDSGEMVPCPKRQRDVVAVEAREEERGKQWFERTSEFHEVGSFICEKGPPSNKSTEEWRERQRRTGRLVVKSSQERSRPKEARMNFRQCCRSTMQPCLVLEQGGNIANVKLLQCK